MVLIEQPNLIHAIWVEDFSTRVGRFRLKNIPIPTQLDACTCLISVSGMSYVLWLFVLICMNFVWVLNFVSLGGFG